MTNQFFFRSKKTVRSQAPNKRELLIEAAILEFAKRGFANTDVQAIANRCSVAKGTIYLYFKSKEELFWTAFLQIASELENIFHKVAVSDLDPIEKIKTALIRTGELFHRNKEYVLIIKQARSFPVEKIPKEATQAVDGTLISTLCDFIREGIEQKRFAPFPVEDYAISIVNGVWGVCVFYDEKIDSMSLPDRIRFTLDMSLNGYLK